MISRIYFAVLYRIPPGRINACSAAEFGSARQRLSTNPRERIESEESIPPDPDGVGFGETYGEENVSTPSILKTIILRGPPGVGKSAVLDQLRSHLGKAARHINLDAYWGKDEWRYSQPDFRYADLQLATEPVLLVELAWGEPAGLPFPGATRGANEWVDILQKAKRKIFPFLLIAEWNDILKRLLARHGHHTQNVLDQLGRASFYEHKHHLFNYPEIPGFTERTIDTTGKTAESVADEIKKVAGL